MKLVGNGRARNVDANTLLSRPNVFWVCLILGFELSCAQSDLATIGAGQSKVFTQKGDMIMRENSKRILSFSAAVLSALSLTAPSGLGAAPKQTSTEPQVLSNAVANEPMQFDVSPPLAELLAEAPAQQGVRAFSWGVLTEAAAERP